MDLLLPTLSGVRHKDKWFSSLTAPLVAKIPGFVKECTP